MLRLSADEINQCFHHFLAQKYKHSMCGLIREADRTLGTLKHIEKAAMQLELLASHDTKAQATATYTENLHDLVRELIKFIPVCFDSVSLEHLIGALKHYAPYVNPTSQPWKAMRLKKPESQEFFLQCLDQLVQISKCMLDRAYNFHQELVHNQEKLKGMSRKRLEMEELTYKIDLGRVNYDEQSDTTGKTLSSKAAEYTASREAGILKQVEELKAEMMELNIKIIRILQSHHNLCHAISEGKASAGCQYKNECIQRCTKTILHNNTEDIVQSIANIDQFIKDVRVLEDCVQKKTITVQNCVLNLEPLITTLMDVEMLEAFVLDWNMRSKRVKALELSAEYKQAADREKNATAAVYTALYNFIPSQHRDKIAIQEISNIFAREFQIETIIE